MAEESQNLDPNYNGEVLDIWTGNEDCYFTNNITDIENNEDFFLSTLRSKTLNSHQKTLFFRFSGLIISHLDGTISDDVFKTTVRDFLLEFNVQNNDLIDKFINQLFNISQEIRFISANDHSFGNEGIKTNSKETQNLRKSIVFSESISDINFPILIELSDFGLVNRCEIAIYAVLLEMGFNQFNRHIKSQVDLVRQDVYKNLKPIYRKGVDLVLNNTIYLVHKTYGIFYHKLYNRILKQLVDKM